MYCIRHGRTDPKQLEKETCWVLKRIHTYDLTLVRNSYVSEKAFSILLHVVVPFYLLVRLS